jgi:hypothetical protein
MTDTAGHVPISVAARIAGVHERTIRRWIAAGVLADSPGRSGGHRARLVDVEAVRQLAAGLHEPDTGGLDSRTDPDRPPREPDTSVADFLAVIERQQQTIMELAGRLGFYQARVQSLEEEVKMLSAPAENETRVTFTDQPPAGTPQPTPEPASAPVRASERPPSRPWWQFWRLVRQPT